MKTLIPILLLPSVAVAQNAYFDFVRGQQQEAVAANCAKPGPHFPEEGCTTDVAPDPGAPIPAPSLFVVPAPTPTPEVATEPEATPTPEPVCIAEDDFEALQAEHEATELGRFQWSMRALAAEAEIARLKKNRRCR